MSDSNKDNDLSKDLEGLEDYLENCNWLDLDDEGDEGSDDCKDDEWLDDCEDENGCFYLPDDKNNHEIKKKPEVLPINSPIYPMENDYIIPKKQSVSKSFKSIHHGRSFEIELEDETLEDKLGFQQYDPCVDLNSSKGICQEIVSRFKNIEQKYQIMKRYGQNLKTGKYPIIDEIYRGAYVDFQRKLKNLEKFLKNEKNEKILRSTLVLKRIKNNQGVIEYTEDPKKNNCYYSSFVIYRIFCRKEKTLTQDIKGNWENEREMNQQRKEKILERKENQSKKKKKRGWFGRKK